MEVPHLLRHTVHAFSFDEADGESSEPRDVVGAMSRADTTSVFIKVPVENVMATILDTPMASIGDEELLRRGLIGRAAREAIGELEGTFPRFFLDAHAFDDERLPDVGEIQVGIEGVGRPDLPPFDPPMAQGGGFDEIWGLAIRKIEDDVLEELGLVAFDREMIMRVPVFNQIGGEGPLGQQGIRGDVLALNREGIEQGRGHRDLVGPLARVRVRYGQGPDFFCV
jgi:hypothetical protein